MEKHTQPLIVFLLFLIYPLLSIPIVLKEIYYRRKYAFYLLAIFYGYIGFLYPPTGDLYRYYLDYLNYKSLDLSGFCQEMTTEFDYIWPSILWITGKLGFNVNVSRFITNTLSYSILFYVFRDLTKQNNNRKTVFFFFVILNLFLGFKVGLVRNGLAIVIFLLGIYRAIFKNKILSGLVIALLSVVTHIFLAPVFLILIFSLLIPFHGNKILTYFLVVGCFVMSSDFLSPLLEMLPIEASLLNHISYYIDGYYAKDYMLDHSLRYRIQAVLIRAGNFFLLLSFCLFFKKSRFSGFVDIFLLLILLVAPVQIIHTRYEIALAFLLLYWFFDRNQELREKTKRKSKKALLFISIFLFLIGVYGVRRELSISKEYQILFPTLFISSDPYPSLWINTNVYPDGAPLVDF